jgi:hypothetical protein
VDSGEIKLKAKREACREIMMQNIYISFSLRLGSLKIHKPAVHEHKVLIQYSRPEK